jgi:hypothetical protein
VPDERCDLLCWISTRPYSPPVDLPLCWKPYHPDTLPEKGARFMITTTLKVNTIHCANCEDDVKISFDDSKVAEAQLTALLRDAGFQPVP